MNSKKLYRRWDVNPEDQKEKGYDLFSGMEELKDHPSMAEDWHRLFTKRVSFRSVEFIICENKYIKIIVENASANIEDIKFNVEIG